MGYPPTNRCFGSCKERGKERERKEREQHFAFISSSVEQELLAQLSLVFFTMGKSSIMSIYFFRPTTMTRKSPDINPQSHFLHFLLLATAKAFPGVQTLGIISCSPLLYQPCWQSVWACCWDIHCMQSSKSHHEREFPTCSP